MLLAANMLNDFINTQAVFFYRLYIYPNMADPESLTNFE